jgi:hypothetical protein
MAVLSQNPFEGSFENLSTKAQGAAKKIVKAAGDAAGAMATDVKQQLTGDYDKPLVEQMGLQTQTSQQQQQIQQNQQALLAQTKQNLDRINAEIKQAREMRIKKEQEKKKTEQQEKQQKQVEERKKQEDPVWKKMLKGKMGSRESGKQASG